MPTISIIIDCPLWKYHNGIQLSIFDISQFQIFIIPLKMRINAIATTHQFYIGRKSIYFKRKEIYFRP